VVTTQFLASFSNGTMNVPKEVRDALGIVARCLVPKMVKNGYKSDFAG
jgi:hypothetical protein